MSLHVIISSPRIASPPRTGAPRIPVPESVQRLRNAPALSVTRRRRKIGFLRRERRFDVVSHTRFAPYFTLILYARGSPLHFFAQIKTFVARKTSCSFH